MLLQLDLCGYSTISGLCKHHSVWYYTASIPLGLALSIHFSPIINLTMFIWAVWVICFIPLVSAQHSTLYSWLVVSLLYKCLYILKLFSNIKYFNCKYLFFSHVLSSIMYDLLIAVFLSSPDLLLPKCDSYWLLFYCKYI